MSELVFVYGSLKDGYPNHGVIERSERLGKAKTFDKKYHMKSFGYFPAVVDNGSYKIRGELYSVSDETMRSLDHLESNGYFYKREPTNVKTEDGQIVEAWMYVLLQDPPVSEENVETIGDEQEWV